MIPTITLEFDIHSNVPIEFKGFPGVALRGSLFQALDILYTGNDPSFTKYYQTDPILHLMTRANILDTITKSSISPFVISPPLSTEENNLTFGVSLFGKAKILKPYITSAVDAMGTIGLGVKRTQFYVRRVRKRIVFAQILDTSIKISNQWAELVEFSSQHSIRNVTVNFVTPTKIIENKTLCLVPTFKTWFQRLIERILQLKLMTKNSDFWLPVEELLNAAQKIEIVDDYTYQYGKVKSRRYTRNIVGFQGHVRYEGDFELLLPYLLLGQVIHVGKNTVKGCGKYRIEVETR